MTQEEIIEIARQAGFVEYELDDGTINAFDKRYEAFAKLVAAKAIKELESQEPVVIVPRRLALNTWAFLAQDCSPCAHKECQIGLKNVGVDTLTDAWNKQLAGNTHPPQRTEQNFCPRCGKRTNDIHTCTPPMENT